MDMYVCMCSIILQVVNYMIHLHCFLSYCSLNLLSEYHVILFVYSSVCRKQELAQLELEKAEDLVASKTSQRDQLVSCRIFNRFAINYTHTVVLPLMDLVWDYPVEPVPEI